jgi:alpha-beta hydrolase superfamily lysophospholipase
MTFRGVRVHALIVLGIGALVAGAIALWLLGSQLVRPANRSVPLPAGFPAQVVSLPGPGHAIASWWLDRGGNSPVVLLVHSIRADRSSMLSRAKLLSGHGLSVLLIDLQGHGETPGAAITLGSRESADVHAALGWLKRTVPARRIGVIGCSLGGAAVLLAPQPSGFDAVVLEAVYPRVAGAVENRIRLRLGPLAPLLAPLLLAQLQPRLHVRPRDLEPVRSIALLGSPVLVVGGSRDENTTLAESEELFRAAVPPKRLWVVRGARHQDFLSFDPAGYESEVVGFLVQHLRPVAQQRDEPDGVSRRRLS